MADELGIKEFPPLIPQLLRFISEKSREPETFFFVKDILYVNMFLMEHIFMD